MCHGIVYPLETLKGLDLFQLFINGARGNLSLWNFPAMIWFKGVEPRLSSGLREVSMSAQCDIFFWTQIHVSMLIALGDATACLKYHLLISLRSRFSDFPFGSCCASVGGPRGAYAFISHRHLPSPISLSNKEILGFSSDGTIISQGARSSRRRRKQL